MNITIKDVFLNLEQKHQGIYKSESFNAVGRGFSSVPVTKHQLSVNHKNTLITLNCDLGNHNLVEIYFTIQSISGFPEVKIYTQDNFLRLFTNRKKPWKVKCKNNLVKERLSNILYKSELTEIVIKTRFEPEITIRKTETLHEVKSTYYLGFDNKEKSIEPMIEFQKDLIDFMSAF